MNKGGHIAAALEFLDAAEFCRERGHCRTEGAGLWGAVCEASNALWDHADSADHAIPKSAWEIRRIMDGFIERGLSSRADARTFQASALALNAHFYAGAISEAEFVAHSREVRRLAMKMLSLA